MSQSVFTIFNHGTDFHRDMFDKEVVTVLSRGVKGNEARTEKSEGSDKDDVTYKITHKDADYLICEGPGSAEVDAKDSVDKVAHAWPSKLNPYLSVSKGTSVKSISPGTKKGFFGYSSFAKDFYGDTKSFYQWKGRMYGDGWRQNVARACFFLANRSTTPKVINMMGWSRGAVTCHMMANRICELFGDKVQINIFAVDPVIGGVTTVTDDMITLPSSVKNYVSVLALDDERENFQPVDQTLLKCLGDTRKLFLPFPGRHQEVAYDDSLGDCVKAALPGAEIVRWLAWRFLRAHGTDFKDEFPNCEFTKYSSVALIQRYDELFKAKKRIALACKHSKNIVGGKRQERDVRKNLKKYSESGEKYLNDHHENLKGYGDKGRMKSFGLAFPFKRLKLY